MSRGAEHAMSSDWIPGAGVGLIGSAVAWLLSWRISAARSEGRYEAVQVALSEQLTTRQKVEDERTERLRQDLRDMREDWRAGIGGVNKLNDNVVALQAKQNTVNEFTAQAVESMATKLDRHDQMLADHTSTIRLLTDVLMQAKKENGK